MRITWDFLGIQPKAVFGEQLVSTLGGMLRPTAIAALSYFLLGPQGALAVVPSMGATTVLS